MKYFMVVKSSAELMKQTPPEGLMKAMDVFVAEGVKSGRLIETGGLGSNKDAHAGRISKGKLSITDGPFAEAKEVVGGFAIVECATDAEARELSRQFMQLHLDHWPEWEGVGEAYPMYSVDLKEYGG
jgi:hypothetical protein